jgi:hypothetical protein
MRPHLEEHIRKLCEDFVSTEEVPELRRISNELRQALSEHINQLRIQLARLQQPTNGRGSKMMTD